MDEPKKKGPQRQCFCFKCDGMLVSVRTELNHRKFARAQTEMNMAGQSHKGNSESSQASTADEVQRPIKQSRVTSQSEDGVETDTQVYEAENNRTSLVHETTVRDGKGVEDLDEDMHMPDPNLLLQDQPQSDYAAAASGFEHFEDDREDRADRYQPPENELSSTPEPFDDGIADPPDAEIDMEDTSRAESLIESVRLAQNYIQAIQSANLDDDKLTPEEIHRLRNPETDQVDLDDPDVRLSIDIYMSCSNASEYQAVRKSVLRRFPDADILSYHRIKALIAKTA